MALPKPVALLVWSAAMAALVLPLPAGSRDAIDPEGARQGEFPTTEFADDAISATVSVGNLAATVTILAPADPEAGALPVLTVSVDDVKVAEATGTETDFDGSAAEASIAEMDPDNDYPEVYFASYSGGAHCCTTVIVVEQSGDRWAVVPVGDFDGDGDYLADVDGDGLAEIATVDNRFLYRFDSYAASTLAPLVVYVVRGGKVVDATTETRYLAAHRERLRQIEEQTAPADRRTSRGFLAGWLAQKIRLGEGARAWAEINENWDFAADEGEEVCMAGGEPEDCAADQLKTVKFPESLRLFLTENGYAF